MMNNDKRLQSIWFDEHREKVFIIDQGKLPFKYKELELQTFEDVFTAITDMIVRGAPLIGITAAYGVYLWVKTMDRPFTIDELQRMGEKLKSSRPTAVNLEKEVSFMIRNLSVFQGEDFVSEALRLARLVEHKEIAACEEIGNKGLSLIEERYKIKGEVVNILTHCNAGWLACGAWGTATAPIYKAHLKGIPVHVWVDETRPRNQGAKLTAWELKQAKVPFTVIPDNTGGHLMQHSMVDMVIVGSDRTTRNGDVANKIGTYLKALAANDNDVPFYVALPSSTIDFKMINGLKNIPIEQRGKEEVFEMACLVDEEVRIGRILPDSFPVANYGFDVTPARLVTRLITERGVCEATEESILNLFLEQNEHN